MHEVLKLLGNYSTNLDLALEDLKEYEWLSQVRSRDRSVHASIRTMALVIVWGKLGLWKRAKERQAHVTALASPRSNDRAS